MTSQGLSPRDGTLEHPTHNSTTVSNATNRFKPFNIESITCSMWNVNRPGSYTPERKGAQGRDRREPSHQRDRCPPILRGQTPTSFPVPLTGRRRSPSSLA
ncbi:hypothetical protein [Phormidium sp. CCY1219]|uniref:hypothetical protein n=1 Tax=Phormidium sp. CCY1219 TaxID=2886104 RepID=UPI002D1F14CC|nr:hypothetical protein [Phormidium sp. CCY1219]MEB3826931.1 hypothetical protein [Phormidium sp. CCY1219]